MPRSIIWQSLGLLLASMCWQASIAQSAETRQDPSNVAKVLGTWEFEVPMNGGQKLTPSILLARHGDQVVGRYTSQFGDVDVTDIRVENKSLTFRLEGERDDRKYEVIYRGKYDGDLIRGTIEFDFGGRTGTVEFTGKRVEEEIADATSRPESSAAVSTIRPAVEPVVGTPDTAGLLGRKIADFTLKDFRGKTHSLSDYDAAESVVIYFMGTQCPLAKLYGPRLQKLADQYGPRSVAFLGINSNMQDSITELAAHARIHNIEFPILKDLGNKVADEFGATRTPQVFVLDRDRAIRYYGRVDAQFTFGSGVGLAEPQQQRADLAIALDELLAGRQITVPVTEVKGCLIGRVSQPAADSAVTYSNQISRIFQRRCVECHRDGQIAPFSMTEYEEVAGWGLMIAEVVREQRMPPWHANPAYGDFANENVLSADEKEAIYAWVKNGCPQGDPANLPEPRRFHEGWFMEREPDRVIYMTDEPVDVKAEGVEPYRYYAVDPGITEDKWVKLAECMPGNRAVVHHIIVYVRPPGQAGKRSDSSNPDIRGMGFLAGFAPGTRPLVSPDGWAKKIPAGSTLVFELHYTPIGSPQTDRSSVGLVFVDESEVTHQMSTMAASNHGFEIPPYDPGYKVEANKKFAHDTILLSLFPHMHMRGKSFRYELVLPGPEKKSEILLDVPQYDFNWQNSFILDEPRLIPAGSEMRCTAYFDNSEGNLANPDPTKSVRWGAQTWDEMMIGWCDIGIPITEAERLRARDKAQRKNDSE